MHHSHLLLDESSLAPATEWEPSGVCWRVVRVAEGQGYWMRPGEVRELSAGTVAVLSPSAAGSFRASQLSAMRLQYFRFCPELMGALLTMTERSFFERSASQAGFTLRIFGADHLVARHYAEICAHPPTRNGLLLRSQVLQLIGIIFERELSRAGTPQRPGFFARKRIKTLMQHLTEEEFLNASANDLAAYCGCSLRHFSRLFLHTFGESLRCRQTELRLIRARQLLAESDTRVVTIAARCGYRHLGVFNALFKRRFGMTPTEWRRAVAEQKDQAEWCASHGSGAMVSEPASSDPNPNPSTVSNPS
jgi:AraC-like DNA-binding protein